MTSLEKWMILAPLWKLANNVGNLGKIIVANSFDWLPKVQKIVQSGHTGLYGQMPSQREGICLTNKKLGLCASALGCSQNASGNAPFKGW